jgi:hypothetical protein
MQLRQLSGSQVVPLLVSITLVIAVAGMLIRGRDAVVAIAVVLTAGAGLASWFMGLV